MKILTIYAIIIASLLVLSGCATETSEPVTTNPFRGGTDSVSISFDPDNPPDEVYEDTPFTIGLNIENTGEYDIPQNNFKIKIQGINPSLYNLQQPEKTANSDLTGTVYDVDKNIIDGAEDYIEFGPLEYQEDLAVVMNDVPLQAAACYAYGTNVVSNVCIKRNILEDNDNDVCVVNEEKVSFSSSAPVKVTEFKETPRGGGTIAFSFRVEHVGAGSVYGTSATVACNPDEENMVTVTVDGPSGLECPTLGGLSGDIKLSEDSGRLVTCTLDVSTVTSDYIEPVSINLEYDYQQLLTTTINVKAVN
jgi:archaellum component FlaG (FlaF/FlaG flagellin family)